MGNKKRQRRFNRQRNSATHQTRHHCIPRSRGGTSDPKNIRLKTNQEHIAWHYLFRNWTPEEVIATLKTKTRKQITKGKGDRKWCWRIIFGKTNTVQEWIEIVQKYWTPFLTTIS